jgi:hypothetical protein
MNEPGTIAETAAPPPEATDTALPSPTLVEVLRKRIADTAAPLKFRDLKKDLKRAKKQSKEAFEAEIRHLLEEDVRAGLVFEHPAKKASDSPLYGSTPYKSPNDREAVSEAMLGAAVSPRKIADLIKAALGATKAEKEFVGSVVNELIASEQLHAHPGKKATDPPLYSTTPYKSPNDREAVSETILAAAVTPRKLEDLIRAALKGSKAEKVFVSVVANELITSEKLHAHPAKKAIDPPLYGSARYRSPNDRTAVSEELLRAAAVPRKLSALIQEISKATKADKDFVSTVASELIAAAQLHDHGKGKLYGVEKPLPPDPFNSGKNTTALAKLTEAARKLMAATGVPAEEMLQRLQAAMMTPLPTPAQPPAEHPTLFTPPLQQPELPSDGQGEARSDVMPTVGA